MGVEIDIANPTGQVEGETTSTMNGVKSSLGNTSLLWLDLSTF
jgi:hypothetical protein